MEIDGGLIGALVHCRLGSGHWSFRSPSARGIPQPQDSDFRRAERLGLLKHHPIWHATHAGEGVLVAVGLLDGKPAPDHATVHVLWAQADNQSTPNFVAAFTAGLVECWETTYHEWRSRAEQEFADFGGDLGDAWRFFTTVEHLPRPTEVPEYAWEVTR